MMAPRGSRFSVLFLAAMQDAEFIAKYKRMVRRVAEQTRVQLDLGATCELEDLVAFGYQGLLEARARFDPERGVAFQAFAYYRVRGAVLDGIRKMAYLPRRAHARLRAIETLDSEAESLKAARAGAPGRGSDTEGTLRALDAVLGRVAAAYCVAQSGDDEREPPGSPEDEVLRRERVAKLQQALSTLDEQERELVIRHDLHGQKLDDLAREMGVSKSWASRMRGRALGRLRRRLSRL